MNLPSSLALSQSKLFQSRLGVLLLALVVIAIGAGLFLMQRNAVRPAVTPTPATSPAAQALPRGPVPPAAPARTAPRVVYGPPAPDWAITKPAPGLSGVPEARVGYGPPAPDWAITKPAPGAAPAPAAAPTTAAALRTTSPVAAIRPVTGAVPTTAPAAAKAAAPPAPASAVPVTQASAVETPRSLDASVLFAREQYVYSSGASRDPFQSLIDGKFQAQATDANLVDVGDIHLVGIMWGSADKYALVEDSRGHGYVLRVGDPVVNGYISGISKTDLQIVQNAFGDSQTLSIHLQPKEGDKNATRN